MDKIAQTVIEVYEFMEGNPEALWARVSGPTSFLR